MKTMISFLLVSLLSAPSFAESRITGDVFIGDSLGDVLEIMGKPSVLIQLEDAALLKYERGTIRLEDDRVVQADLITPEEAYARRQQAQIQYEQHVANLKERKERRVEEGYELKRARLADPYFQSLPAERQVAFWRQFQTRYPDVPSQSEYLAALTRLEHEREQEREIQREREAEARLIAKLVQEERDRAEEREQEVRIRELEQRLRAAEERATREPVVVQRVYQPVSAFYVSRPQFYQHRIRSAPCETEVSRTRGDTRRIIYPDRQLKYSTAGWRYVGAFRL